nr:dual specificity protein kinase splA [Tanacetum cinerariifolium]
MPRKRVGDHTHLSRELLRLEYPYFIFTGGNVIDVVVPVESIQAISKSSTDGLNSMLENGSWFICNHPLILRKWNPDVDLLKEDVGNVPVWVKLHGVPVTTFIEDGLSAIATKLVCKTRTFALGDKPHSFFAPEGKPPRRGLNPRPLACGPIVLKKLFFMYIMEPLNMKNGYPLDQTSSVKIAVLVQQQQHTQSRQSKVWGGNADRSYPYLQYKPESKKTASKDPLQPDCGTSIAEVEAGHMVFRIGYVWNCLSWKMEGNRRCYQTNKKKLFCRKSSEQECLTKDFWREAQMLSNLHRPNMVALYGVVPDGLGGTLSTVTEYMSNSSLRHVLKENNSLQEKLDLVTKRISSLSV